MNFKKTQLALALSLLLQFPTLIEAQSTSYEAGHEAMHKQQYQKALEKFKEAETDENYSDSSLYWQSYALFKMNQGAVARRTLKKLVDNYPDSRWIDDAEILALEYDAKKDQLKYFEKNTEKQLKEIELSDELRLFAIQQLMFKDAEKGLSLAKELLEKSEDHKIKSNALELMGISEADEASRYLYEFIVENNHKGLQENLAQITGQAMELKRQAIQMLGMRDNMKSYDMLKDLYHKSTNKDIKSSIIESFIHASDHKQLLKMLEKEKDQDLNEQMIRLLGVMGAQDELREMAKHISKQANKKALLDALALSGDKQSIKSMIEQSQDPQVKLDAIQSLIMLDDENIDDYLFNLYQKSNDKAIKEEIINVFIATESDSGKIKQLIDDEQNDSVKVRLLESLMVMEDKGTLLQLLSTESNTHQRKEIINLLGVMGAYNELQKIYHDSDHKQQRQIIEAISIDGTMGREEFFYSAYHNGDKAHRKAVINAFMISENTPALLHLLKNEKDPSLKKSLIQTISMTDPEYLLNNLEKSQSVGEKQ